MAHRIEGPRRRRNQARQAEEETERLGRTLESLDVTLRAWLTRMWDLWAAVTDIPSRPWFQRFMLRALIIIFTMVLWVCAIGLILGIIDIGRALLGRGHASVNLSHRFLQGLMNTLARLLGEKTSKWISSTSVIVCSFPPCLMSAFWTGCGVPHVPQFNGSQAYSEEYVKMTLGFNTEMTEEMVALRWLESDLAMVSWYSQQIKPQFKYGPFSQESRNTLNDLLEQYSKSSEEASFCLQGVNAGLDVFIAQSKRVFDDVIEQSNWRHFHYAWARVSGQNASEAHATVTALYHEPLKILTGRIERLIPEVQQCNEALGVAREDGRRLFESLRKCKIEVHDSRGAWRFYKRPNKSQAQNQDLLLLRGTQLSNLGVKTLQTILMTLLDIREYIHQLNESLPKVAVDYQTVDKIIGPHLEKTQLLLRNYLSEKGKGPPNLYNRITKAQAIMDAEGL